MWKKPKPEALYFSMLWGKKPKKRASLICHLDGKMLEAWRQKDSPHQRVGVGKKHLDAENKECHKVTWKGRTVMWKSSAAQYQYPLWQKTLRKVWLLCRENFHCGLRSISFKRILYIMKIASNAWFSLCAFYSCHSGRITVFFYFHSKGEVFTYLCVGSWECERMGEIHW